ncbi:RHS repeat-associated core domain-containing protein [Streptomyces sp. NPDC002012]|uniref:RHS repeat-associated core domain-containing protein n=1 Tax=Streptomyces sp. NPDC002012 TaxID=3154532 RepID=UPI00331B087C
MPSIGAPGPAARAVRRACPRTAPGRRLVDERGDVTWHTRSTLWGTTVWTATSSTYTPLRFPGQYFDSETGLHYDYFRHYDPESGRRWLAPGGEHRPVIPHI